MTNDVWAQMEAEIQTRFEKEIGALQAQGKTIYDQQIDPDDTSEGAPELWCIVRADTQELVRGGMSEADVAAFVSSHPDWVNVWEVHDRIQDEVRERD